MNSQAITATNPSSADIQTRISDERRRLMLEQNLDADLEKQRIAPLEAGDDEALDRVEAQMVQCRDRQSRIQERLELLEQRLALTVQSEHQADLDVIAERANKARELGEKLIRVEYKKHALALASVLQKLSAIDALIRSSNEDLGSDKRPLVSSPNDIRCAPFRYVDWDKIETVSPAHSLHPRHAFAQRAATGNSWFDIETKQTLDLLQISIPTHDAVVAIYREPLYEAITLPAIEPDAQTHVALPKLPEIHPIWQGSPEANPDAIAALIEELDQQRTKAAK